MKAVTLYFQNLEPNLCIYRFALAFLPFDLQWDLTFGKFLNIYEKSHIWQVPKQLAKDTNSLAHVQKIEFLQMPR